jgi:hypothetical protein
MLLQNFNAFYVNLQADPNADVRGRMINVGILIIDKHGKENVPLLFPIFDSYLNKKASNLLIVQMLFNYYVVHGFLICYISHWSQASDEESYDLVREGVVIFTGALAKHLSKVTINYYYYFILLIYSQWSVYYL